ncbi:hypothetical protein SELMODRAFT_424420 [Selaginella moellendorffii]|uniref:Uncharacterized protein n=1 Tax=Selaginella moellendorffii TaxID=88036 RepID=D8SPU3_SELML|nr:hypothetical protein SELMODRAFT_424420 [Selaginella moellendorffii]
MYGMLSGQHHGTSFPVFHQQQQQELYERCQQEEQICLNGLLSSTATTTTTSSSSSGSSHSHSHAAVFLSSNKSLKAALSSNNITGSNSNSSWEVATATATAAGAAARTGQQLPEREHFHHHHQHYNHNQQLLAIDSTGVISSTTAGGGFAGEPTSVLDLRSPSPNNSRALGSASSSSAIRNNTKKAGASSSSSSDCNNSTTDAAKVKSRGNHHQEQQQQRQQQQISSSFAQSSSSADLQDELEQAVAAASSGYGLSLFYSGQGIRQMENYGRSDQWLLQDVVGAQQDELLVHHLHQQQHLLPEKQKLEELESELLGSCPSPGVPPAAPAPDPSIIRWLFEEPFSGSAAAAGAADVNVIPPPPPWQQQVMMMVKQEQQQQLSSSSSTSSLPPHLAHLESFTRRTLPLVSSGAPLFHHPHPMQFQDPLAMNSLWQQQQQQQQQQHNLQIGLEHQQQHREPFLLGMLQDEQHQQHMPNLFGQAPSFMRASSPRALHPGLFVENPGPSPLQLLQQQQERELQQAGKRQASRIPYVDEHVLLRPQPLPPSLKREQQELQHPSSKVARLSPPNAQPGHPLQQHVLSSNSGAFPSRLLLHAAEACESGQDELAQSILARLNDHHHHQVFLQQQEHHQNQQFHKLQPPAYRIGLLFRDILAERLSKRKARSSTPAPASTDATEVVERIAACKSLYDTSTLLKCAHFIANQAIAEAIESEECVHILDLSEAANSPSMNSSFGGQWSSFVASTLEQKLPRPIKIRITLTSTRQHALYFALESLRELARDHPKNAGCAEFEFCGVLTRSGSPLSLSDMGLKVHEVLVVNFVFGLHKLVPVAEALDSIRASHPKIVLLVEQEMEPQPSFIERFREGLDYYTALAECVAASEECSLKEADKVEQLVWKPEVEELLAGNLEHQRLEKWNLWMSHAGLCCSKLSDMCEKLALGLFNFEKAGNNKTRGFDLVKDDGSLLLGFQGKVLASASAWKCC